MTSPLTEGKHPGSFLLSEANGNQSRENVTIVSGQDLSAGQVLGKITSGGKYTALDQAASDGSQTAAGVLWDNVDASGGDTVAAIIARDAEVISEELEWGGQSPTEVATGVTELAALGILVRTHATEA